MRSFRLPSERKGTKKEDRGHDTFLTPRDNNGQIGEGRLLVEMNEDDLDQDGAVLATRSRVAYEETTYIGFK